MLKAKLHSCMPDNSKLIERDNGNDHRAAAKDLQAEKAARPAAPCATYCYHASLFGGLSICFPIENSLPKLEGFTS